MNGDLLALAGIGQWVHDRQTIHSWNGVMQILYLPAEATEHPQTFEDFLSCVDDPGTVEEILSTTGEGQSYRFICNSIQTKKIIEHTGRREGGRFYEIVKDITFLYRDAETLESDLAKAADSSSDFFIFIDQEMRLTSASSSFEKLVGQSVSEMILSESTLGQVLCHEDAQRVLLAAYIKQWLQGYALDQSFRLNFVREQLSTIIEIKGSPVRSRRTKLLLVGREISEPNLLSSTEVRYSALLRNIAGAVVLLKADPKRTILCSNPSASEILGISNLMEGETPLAPVIHPEDLSCVLQSVEDACKDGLSQRIEYRARVGGQEKYFCESLTPVETEQGTLISSIITDFTEQKRSTESLAYSLSLQETIFDAINDGIIVVSHEGAKIVAWNKRFQEIWNVPDSLLIQGDDWRLVDYMAAQVSRSEDFWREVYSEYSARDGNPYRLYRLKDGRILERVSKRHVLNGENVGLVISYRDLSDRLAIAEQLHANPYEAVLDSLPVMCCRFTPGLIITYANKDYCDFYQKTKVEIIGKSFLENIPAAQRSYVLKNIQSLGPQSKSIRQKHEQIRGDGVTVLCEWIDNHTVLPDGSVEYFSIGWEVDWCRPAPFDTDSAITSQLHFPN